MTTKNDKLPSFKKPPVVEVICSAQFEPLVDFVAPHAGLFWQVLQPEYGFVKELPPLPNQIEQPTILTGERSVNVTVHQVPPLPRLWFINSDESSIVQIQRDRLITNWKKIDETTDYPRFGKVYEHFKETLQKFRDFVKDGQLGEVKPTQYELTYVNQIPVSELWDNYAEIGTVLPDHIWRSHKFLPAPEGIHWTTTFRLPNNSGRLYITAASAQRLADSTAVLQLTLAVRGMSAQPEATDSWFEMAREWIVEGFVDLTGDIMQNQVWDRER